MPVKVHLKAAGPRSAEAMVFNCSTCGEGLDCPTSSSIANLQSASSAAGENFVPQIAAGYFATKEETWGGLRSERSRANPFL